MKSLLCEVALSARRTKSQFNGLYKGILLRRGKKRAIVAVAHKILEVAFVVLKRMEPYRDPSIDYEALVVKRNAPRWLKALVRHGYNIQAGA